MRKVFIGLLIATGIGAVLFFVGLPSAEDNFTLCGIGLVIYCLASAISGFASGASITKFFNWQADSGCMGCLMFPLYAIIYPIMGAIMCVIGWVFAIKKLSELPKAPTSDNRKNIFDQIRNKKEKKEAELGEKPDGISTKQKKKTLIIILLSIIGAAIVAAAIVLTVTVFIPNSKYKQAQSLMETQEYDKAVEIFRSIHNYKDSRDLIEECKNRKLYNEATEYLNKEQFEEAADLFERLGNYENSKELFEEASDKRDYIKLETLLDSGEYDEVYSLIRALDKNEKVETIIYEHATDLLDAASDPESLAQAETLFGEISDYKDSSELKVKSKVLQTLMKVDSLIYKENAAAADYLNGFSYLKDIIEYQNDYSDEIDSRLFTIAYGALYYGSLDTAIEANDLIKNREIVTNDFTDALNSAIENREVEKANKEREKQIEDAYNSVIGIKRINEDNINEVERLFSIIPDNYKQIEEYKTVFYFYKPYIGSYYESRYGTSGYSLYLYKKDSEVWAAGFSSSTERYCTFDYLSLYAYVKVNSSMYKEYFINSPNSISSYQHMVQDFYTTYTR